MQLTRGQNIRLDATALVVGVVFDGATIPRPEWCAVAFDPTTAIHVNSSSHVAAPIPGVTLSDSTVRVDLHAVSDPVERVVVILSGRVGLSGFTTTLDGPDGTEIARFAVPVTAGETAMLVCEIYRRQGMWKLRAVGQGYQGGLDAAAADLGFEIAAGGPPPPDRGDNPVELAGSLRETAREQYDRGEYDACLDSVRESTRLLEQNTTQDPDSESELADSLALQGVALAAAGRADEAIGPSERSVAITTRLAEHDPETYTRGLASTTHNLGRRYAAVGRTAEARDCAARATELYERLAAADPHRHLVDVVHSLTELGDRLMELGATADALSTSERAVRSGERLVELTGGEHRGDLAATLIDLAARYHASGRPEDSVGAEERLVQVVGETATEEPTNANRASYATELSNLGAYLSMAGRDEEALAPSSTAVSLFEELAAADPGRYTLSLAQVVAGLAGRLNNAGRTAEALPQARRTVELYEQLCATAPEEHLNDLVIHYIVLRNTLARLDNDDESIAVARHAVSAVERLSDGSWTARVALLSALQQQTDWLDAAGRGTEAIESCGRLVTVADGLARDRTAFEGAHGRVLDLFGQLLKQGGRNRDAVDAAAQSVEVFRRCAARDDAEYSGPLAIAAMRLGLYWGDCGEPERAIGPALESVGLLERLAAQNPSEYEQDLGLALHNLIDPLADNGRADEALRCARRAVDIRERLADGSPDRAVDLCYSLNNLAVMLDGIDDRAAVRYAEHAVELLEPLAESRLDLQRLLAMTLNTLGTELDAIGDGPGGLRAAQQSVAIYEQLAAARPAEFGAGLASSLVNLSNRLSDIGQAGEALTAAARATQLMDNLSAADRAAHPHTLAVALYTLGVRLAVVGRLNEAIEPTSRALQIFEARPHVYRSDIQQTLVTLDKMYRNGGRFQDAAAIQRRLAALPR